MRVHPKQLIPGCIILKDVMGKTSHPIIPKNTVVNELHITFLEKFLIKQVEVSTVLSHGVTFKPKELSNDELVEDDDSTNLSKKKNLSFEDLYSNAVKEYKRLFIRIQSGNPIDINQVRKFIVPLLAKIDDAGLQLYLLHNYSSKKDYFFHHSVAMSLISAFLAKKLGHKKEWVQVGLAGLLADSGMAKINRQILNKQGVLTFNEYEEIKKHPTYSYRLVEKIPSLSIGVKLAILQHHERLDGNGYPLGVNQDKIHLFARILAVSDMYHAMTSERIYQNKQSPFKVIEEMMQDQFDKLDHQILQQFITMLTNFSTGMKVQLSNNKNAEIVYIEANFPTRPMVRLEGTNDILPLKTNKDLYIKEIIAPEKD